MMSAVADTAQHMINNKHYACADVSNRLDELQIQLQVLKDYAAQRRAKLLDAVESQMVCEMIWDGGGRRGERGREM